MDNEFEEKRKEKIESFKVHIEDDSAGEGTDISSNEKNEADFSDYSSNRSILDEYNDNAGVDVGSENISSDEEYDENNENTILNSYSGEQNPQNSNVNKKDLKKAKKADKIRRKKKAQKNRRIFRMVWLAMILFVSIMLGRYITVGVNDMLTVGREEENSVEITIPKDASIYDVADILYENGVINNRNFFIVYAFLTNSTTGFTQGTFEVYTNKDYQALINYMQSDMNRTDIVTLQFTEGMSISEYAELLEENDVCSQEDFLELCSSDEFDEDYEFIGSISNADERYYKLEGYLFPDTYDFYIGEDADSVIKKFLANYRKKVYTTKSKVDGFDTKVTIEERAEAVGMSMEDVLIIASLIQAEAANEDDMYVISSIIHNRLDTLETGGINDNGESGLNYLQLDSTLYYPYTRKSEIPAALAESFVSAYDTYENEGLPIGPICNPGLAAIEAAISYTETEYYYFFHSYDDDGTVTSYYSATLSDHLGK